MSPRPASKERSGSLGHPSCQKGVGLIEVLIAVLVLSIGLMGIAAVQTRALSNNNSAMARSMATVASYSILDAMRVDRTNALAGAYNATISANNCPTAGSFAQNQLNTWCSELGYALGAVSSTTGQIACATTGECTITITFDDSRVGVVGSSTQQIVTKALL